MADTTRSVERAFDVLAVVCDRPNLALSDIAARTDLPLTTTHRILQTLLAGGHVLRSEQGLFTAGPQTIWLGSRALANDSLRSNCQPVMAELAATTGESIYLSVRHGDFAQYIGAAMGGRATERLNWEGREIPLAGSAAGQALTGQVGEQGHATLASGIEWDMTALAAPVRLGGFPVAALSVVIPTERVATHPQQDWGSLIVEAARRISDELGASQPHRRPPRSIETVRRRAT